MSLLSAGKQDTLPMPSRRAPGPTIWIKARFKKKNPSSMVCCESGFPYLILCVKKRRGQLHR